MTFEFSLAESAVEAIRSRVVEAEKIGVIEIDADPLYTMLRQEMCEHVETEHADTIVTEMIQDTLKVILSAPDHFSPSRHSLPLIYHLASMFAVDFRVKYAGMWKEREKSMVH